MESRRNGPQLSSRHDDDDDDDEGAGCEIELHGGVTDQTGLRLLTRRRLA